MLFLAAIYAAGWLLIAPKLDSKAAGSLLSGAGFLFGLATGMLAFLFRKYDEAPPKEMSASRKRKFELQLNMRRKALWANYGLAIACMALSWLAGWALSNGILDEQKPHFVGLGFVAVFGGALLALRAIREFQQVSHMLRTLTAEYEERKRKIETLNDLRGVAKKA